MSPVFFFSFLREIDEIDTIFMDSQLTGPPELGRYSVALTGIDPRLTDHSHVSKTDDISVKLGLEASTVPGPVLCRLEKGEL